MARASYAAANPEAYQAMRALSAYVRSSGLERPLLEMVDLRVSQINGCTFCIAMHTREAREVGVGQERLTAVETWRESTLFAERERAALAWSEAVTVLGESRVSDEEWSRARAHFSESELMALTVAVAAINAWNRIAISFRA